MPADQAPDFSKPYDPREVEPRWYECWEQRGVFAASDDADDTRPVYVVPMPPPNVTGSLHMGHALHCTLEDVLVRWHRMRGYNTLWQPGIDHAGHRHADGRRAAARARRQDAPRPRARGVRRARVAVEGARAAAASRCSSACSARRPTGAHQVHDGPGHEPRRDRGVRAPLRGGPDVPRDAPHQLVPRVHARRSAISRSRTKRARTASSSSSRTRSTARTTRSSSPRRAPRRCSATPRSPCTRTIRATRICTARRVVHPFVDRDRPDHHRRDSRRSEVRHRRREGHARARLQRLRDRQAPRARGDQHLRTSTAR